MSCPCLHLDDLFPPCDPRSYADWSRLGIVTCVAQLGPACVLEKPFLA
jgi:hypothetical protein